MPTVCFYFHVHQPYRLRKYTAFDIGNNSNYFDEEKNLNIIQKVAKKCYLPTNNILLHLIKKHKDRFKISFSISGVIIEQFEKYAQEVLHSFKALADTGCVEFVAETYYHSLSSLYSIAEFKEQILLHKQKIKELFNQTPKIFRNTELIFSNRIAKVIEALGFNGVLVEGAESILEWRSPHFVYALPNTNIKLLLRNYKLSDDIAFRFSNKQWSEYPLTVDKYSSWISGINGNGVVVNLFMDYETFGEHQWESTGIFEFLKLLPSYILRDKDNNFMTVSEAIENYPPVATLNIPNFVSWADIERDLSAWLGNRIQKSAIENIYKMEWEIKRLGNKKLLEDWRKLTTSDHYYYMCTKWFADGDVHKYFNPYDNPYEAFIWFMNVLKDIKIRADKLKKEGMMAAKKTTKKKCIRDEAIVECAPEKSFFLCNGGVFRSVKELHDGLDTMSDDVFYHHVTVERNDFANWIRDVFENHELANKIAATNCKESMKKAISTYMYK